MLTDSSNYRATFAADSSLYPGANGKADFIEDIAYCQSRGQKVLISFGGERGYGFALETVAARDEFLRSASAIIEEYGFDGFDVDIEALLLNTSGETSMHNPTKPLNNNFIYVLHELASRFGPDFIISMAPEHPYVQGGVITWGGWGNIFGGYLPLLDNIRDILTYIHPQYYNNEISYPGFSGYSAASLVKLSEMLIQGFDVVGQGHFDGLRPDQVAMCVIRNGSSNGALPIAEYASALSQMLQKYPDFRGIALWAINEDALAGGGFLPAMKDVIRQQYSSDDSSAYVVASPSESSSRRRRSRTVVPEISAASDSGVSVLVAASDSGASAPAAASGDWNAVGNAGVEASISQSSEVVDSAAAEVLKRVSVYNEDLIKKTMAIDIKAGGTSVSKLTVPLMVVVDVSNLPISEKMNLTGVRYDPGLKTYKQLGGELSSDESKFIFHTYESGIHGLVISNNLTKISLAIGSNTVSKNSAVSANDVAPYISSDNRTMTPLRVIAETLGADVSWTDTTKTVTIQKGAKTLSLTINQPLPDGMGTAVIVNNRTFVPIRYIAEQLGANVVYDDVGKTVKIWQ
jgi:chitinase